MVEKTQIASTSPRSSKEICKQLSDIEEVIRIAEEYGTPDFASKIALESMLAHKSELQEELCAASLLESKADAEIVLEGAPVHEYTVQALFLGDVLKIFQNLMNSIAQVKVGEPTPRAAIRRNIIAENRLFVLPEFQEGSFILRLKLPTKEELDQLLEVVSPDTLNTVCSILCKDTLDQEAMQFVSHSRVRKHYSDFMDILAKRGADILVRNRVNPFGSRVTCEQARQRIEWLELLQETEKVITVDGVLAGGSVETGRFELWINEDESYKGSVSEKAKKLMKNYKFGELVRATIQETTTLHDEMSTEQKSVYHLLDLSNV